MKSLKTMIVFLSCLSFFCTVVIADEDQVDEGDGAVSENFFDEDNKEIFSVIEALEDLYSDQDVMIFGVEAKNDITMDTGNVLDDGEEDGSGDEVIDEGGDDEESDSGDNLGESGEKIIQISIYKNENEETHEIDKGTVVDLEQTDARKRRKPRGKRYRVRLEAQLETFPISPRDYRLKCPTYYGVAFYTYVKGNDAKNRKLGTRACFKANNRALGKAMHAMRKGSRCRPSSGPPRCKARLVRR